MREPLRDADSPVLVTQLPYALSVTTFRFAALAALAGRAPIGGQREVALATYLAARLADDVRSARNLSPATRAERAGSARSWMSNLALPNTVRPALVRLVEASANDTADTARALRVVIGVTATLLDSGAQSELERLATALEQS
ncbi:MAG: hypothetical protein ABJF01_10730 [bacterium]